MNSENRSKKDHPSSVVLKNKAAYERHEYLRDPISWKYQNCKSCSLRTLFACITCGFCWSCHWKVEELAKVGSGLLQSTLDMID